MKELKTEHIPMQFIHCEEVEQTKEIKELADSIKEQGLLHPITVQSVNKGDETPAFKVIAGRRRLAACDMIGIGEMPCIIVEGDEAELQLLQIEENLRRHNLPWWEQVDAISNWHALQQELKGVYVL